MLISEATLTAWKPATFCGPTSPHKWGWFFLTNQMLFSVFNFSCTSQFCPHQLAESCDSKKISFIGICSTQKGGLFLKMFAVGNRVWALFLQSCAAHFVSNFTQLIIIIMWNWFIDDNNDDRTFNAFLAFQFQWVHGSKHFYLLRFWKDCSELNVSTLAMSWSSLPAVDTLSDSNSGADDPESASKSSSSSADVAAKPAAKRKKCALDDEVQAFLAFCATNWANRPNAWSTSSWLCPVRRHEIVASRSTPQRFIWRCTLHFQRNSGNAVPLPGQNPTYHKTLLNSWQVSLAHKRCEEWKHYVVLTFSACVIALQSQCQLWQYDTFRRQLC